MKGARALVNQFPVARNFGMLNRLLRGKPDQFITYDEPTD